MLPGRVKPEPVLSAFGELFEKLREAKGLTKMDLAQMAGVSRSVLTDTLRDAEWAKRNGYHWHAPPLDKVDIWADAFGLTGAEREHFKDLADLAHAPPRLLARIDDLKAQVRALGERVRALEQQSDERRRRHR
jgi:transcriptional regulator with XRE-family HTH domain